MTELAGRSLGAFLDDLAARVPAPGGGASAGVHLAQAGALLGMVAACSTGPRYAQHADRVAAVAAVAEEECHRGLQLAAADAAAFTAVGVAHRIPRGSDGERVARDRAVQQALAGAVRPPVEVVRGAARLLDAAEQLLPVANPTVLTDVGAATEAARAAATTARLVILVNLRELTDPGARSACTPGLAVVEEVVARAAEVDRRVRERVR
ncbi:cyclodeaminase/cyclohydrolase family protein [Klenkia taihuensis]|uniref:Formiminotetrahydrofolate cyclodeaminase n=1 Tax=Klenkia taihuensis TaxID=1225127 RepID=A0A1I1R7R8_9ACTN|nr:cyclodeaminase/cyclohydrolase family protein [Klenkia taihuensis]GHE07425.1 formiminotransferase-cyclodeaminase [Klenkia taihuensis]SFD26360.1 Formiminotetrahydrofolate cyclodeaminase [Klenkia taihuensis]